MSTRHKRALLALAALLTAACSTTEERLRARFAHETRCSTGAVTVQQSGQNYRVSGCGQTEEYVCVTFAGASTPRCERAPGREPWPRSGSPSDVDPVGRASRPPPPR